MATTRYRTLVLLLAAVLIPLSFIAFHPDTRAKVVAFGSSWSISSSQPEWVLIEDMEEGAWIPTQHPVNISSLFHGVYQTVDNLWETLEGEATPEDDDAKSAAKRARAEAIASWEWTGRGAVPPVDWEELAVRALRSTGGLIILGDSLQGQLFDHLQIGIFPPDTLVHLDVDQIEIHGTYHTIPVFRSLSLPPDSVKSHALLARAGAPVERLQRPIVTFIRDDALVAAEQLAQIVAAARNISLEEASRPGVVTNTYLANWTARIEADIQPIKLSNFEFDGEYGEQLGYWYGNRKTVIVANTGAHWAPGTFAEFTDEERMLSAYRAGAKLTLETLRSFRDTILLFRPTIPGHVYCERSHTPVATLGELEPILPYPENYGWGLFPKFNDVWAYLLRDDSDVNATLDVEKDASVKGWKPKGWLPIYQRSRLRPDAHALAGDCLHSAGPAIVDEWLKWLWKEVTDIDSEPEAL